MLVPMTKISEKDLSNDQLTYLYLKRKSKKSNKVIEACCERTWKVL